MCHLYGFCLTENDRSIMEEHVGCSEGRDAASVPGKVICCEYYLNTYVEFYSALSKKALTVAAGQWYFNRLMNGS